MSEAMSGERLAEIRREYEDFPTTEVADLLAEVERLRAELDETRREREQYRLSLPAEVQDYWAWRKRSEIVEAERDRLAEQRAAAIKLVSDAYTDAGADVQEGGAWPEWGPSVDGDDVLKALDALDGTEATP